MSGPTHAFEHFLSRAHRRNLALRLLERGGLGILGGCLAALPLLGIVIWRGGDAVSFALVAITVGTLAGLLWGLLTRPSPMATALEADRQLGWPDLLSSAAMVQTRATVDPYAAAVIWAADAKCRATSPSALVLHHLGARAWGGIGLASALVLVLALFPAFATPSQAGHREMSGSGPVALFEPEASPTSRNAQPLVRGTAREQDPDDPNASKMGESEREGRNRSDERNDGSARVGDRQNSSRASSNGQGTGASQSKVDQPGGLNSPSASNAGRSDANAAHASGGTGRSIPGIGDGQATGQSAAQAASRPPRATPPWRSSTWAESSRRAMDALDSGQVPDAYRDVIRAYFDRP